MSALFGTSTREVLARKLVAGDVLADGSVVTEVRLSKGKRTMSKLMGIERRSPDSPRSSGYPVLADLVIVHLEGADRRLPRRYWPRQLVEVRDVG